MGELEAVVKPDHGSYPESRVLIIITGGTICMQASAGGLVPVDGFLEGAMRAQPAFNDSSEMVQLTAIKDGKTVLLDSLRTPPSSYSRHIRYAALEFSPLLDSSSISSDGWTKIAASVKANYHLFDGFVVLHGTDSLAYSASALSFMMEDLGKAVVLTGSQASIFALQSDAVDNLLGSLIIAGTFVIPEVCLFFHHTLYRGNRTTKVSASSFKAFASPNCEPLAKVTGVGVEVNWSVVQRQSNISRFQVRSHLNTAHVACIRIFPGILPEMVDSVLKVPNLRGLILETFGMGNAPAGVDGSLTNVIRSAVARGVIIVNVSQCTNGFVSPLYAPGFALGQAGVVFGHDMTTEAALTKLSYLFTLGLDDADIKSQMAQSLCGELTELLRPAFSHPGRSVDSALNRLQGADAVFTLLGYAIRDGDLGSVMELLDADPQLLKRADYVGNTVCHMAAVGPERSVLKELLLRGASVHARNRANITPLFLALKAGKKDFADLLTEAGASLWHGERCPPLLAEAEKEAGSNGNGTRNRPGPSQGLGEG